METTETNGSKKKAEKAPPERAGEVKVKKSTDWSSLLRTAQEEHWRKLLVKIQLREKLHAGKPANLDVAKAMIKARGLEDQLEPLPLDPETRAEMAEEVAVMESLCEFTRRKGKEGIWFPSHHIKAGLKENLSALKITVEKRGTKGEMHECIFVCTPVKENAPPEERNWIYLGEKPNGIDTSVTHSQTKSGPISAIKRNEYVLKPEITFELWISRRGVSKLNDADLATVLVHFGEHGLGANRSSGQGRFDMVSVKEMNE